MSAIGNLIFILLFVGIFAAKIIETQEEKKRYSVGHKSLKQKDKRFGDIKEAIDYFVYLVEANEDSNASDRETIRRAVKFEGNFEQNGFVIFDKRFKKKI